ncbi:uncharacterized protein LOC112042849 [Bicyclus anynana]|uniref:Uncharacterized protein LOC112042849 n=1 Tax=Bicyclus anynana TaxID=110368 RepID=A0A6J1MTH8_BICAN|nr:uncharacterized protein LOC112042849 [Bicyclus anynana]
MTSLYVITLGLLHLLTVELAPSPLNNRFAASHIGLDGLKVPILDNRFNLEDKRQNWGILINGSMYDEKEVVNDGYRPISIPRLSTIKPQLQLQAENVEKAPEININFKAKRNLKTTPEVNNVSKVDDASKTTLPCDIARIKCCFDKTDLDNCYKASECLKLEVTSADLCNTRALQESIRKVLNWL